MPPVLSTLFGLNASLTADSASSACASSRPRCCASSVESTVVASDFRCSTISAAVSRKYLRSLAAVRFSGIGLPVSSANAVTPSMSLRLPMRSSSRLDTVSPDSNRSTTSARASASVVSMPCASNACAVAFTTTGSFAEFSLSVSEVCGSCAFSVATPAGLNASAGLDILSCAFCGASSRSSSMSLVSLPISEFLISAPVRLLLPSSRAASSSASLRVLLPSAYSQAVAMVLRYCRVDFSSQPTRVSRTFAEAV